MLIVASVGILGLYLFWKPELRAKMLYQKVADINLATHLLIGGQDGNVEICDLRLGFN